MLSKGIFSSLKTFDTWTLFRCNKEKRAQSLNNETWFSITAINWIQVECCNRKEFIRNTEHDLMLLWKERLSDPFILWYHLKSETTIWDSYPLLPSRDVHYCYIHWFDLESTKPICWSVIKKHQSYVLPNLVCNICKSTYKHVAYSKARIFRTIWTFRVYIRKNVKL